jgi:hypothetical protein
MSQRRNDDRWLMKQQCHHESEDKNGDRDNSARRMSDHRRCGTRREIAGDL